MFGALKSFFEDVGPNRNGGTGSENIFFKDVYELFDLLLWRHGSGESKAQIKQDIFVLIVLAWKQRGFFVEFGATDGVELSNTHLLEKDFGWDGILAEPAPMWHDALSRNRNVNIEFDCVWRETGATVQFDVVSGTGLSTISNFSANDMHEKARRNCVTQEVRTISLGDLLRKYRAPRTIDYLSVDTEGSEYDILEAFDFDEYDVRVITVEHNYTPMREKLFSLLTSQNYVRVLEDISQWDDWYIKKS